MLATQSASRRQAVRRAVQLTCAVRSELWDGPAPFVATDLSPHGLRLCSPLALPEGEDVVVTFTPPRWPEGAGPVNALARVTHVAVPRRKSDLQEPGMGLSFVHLDATSSALMALVLRGLPPPLPAAQRALVSRMPSAPTESELVLWHDGLELTLRAEAPLLTAYCGLAPTPPVPHEMRTLACEQSRGRSAYPTAYGARQALLSAPRLTRRGGSPRSNKRRCGRARRPARAVRASAR